VQTNLSVRHGQLSEASREKIKAKVEKLSRIFERMMSIEVVVDLADEDHPSVEITASAEHKHDFVATEKASGLLAAVDGATHKIEQQVRRYKEKIQARSRGNSRRQQLPTADESEEFSEGEEG